MDSRLVHIVDNMHKQANIFSGLANLAKANVGASAGAVLGGAVGAYKGSQGPEGGLKGAILGGAQGAAGGAMVGYAAENFGKGAFGKNSVGKQLKANTAKLDKEVLENVSEPATGFLSKFRNRRAYRATQADKLKKINDRKQDIYEAVDANLMSADKAREAVDALNKSNIFSQRDALKQQRLYGTIGAGMLATSGAKLINEGTKSGQSADADIVKNLQAKYQQTGKLDEREMRVLTEKMRGTSAT